MTERSLFHDVFEECVLWKKIKYIIAFLCVICMIIGCFSDLSIVLATNEKAAASEDNQKEDNQKRKKQTKKPVSTKAAGFV